MDASFLIMGLSLLLVALVAMAAVAAIAALLLRLARGQPLMGVSLGLPAWDTSGSRRDHRRQGRTEEPEDVGPARRASGRVGETGSRGFCIDSEGFMCLTPSGNEPHLRLGVLCDAKDVPAQRTSGRDQLLGRDPGSVCYVLR